MASGRVAAGLCLSRRQAAPPLPLPVTNRPCRLCLQGRHLGCGGGADHHQHQLCGHRCAARLSSPGCVSGRPFALQCHSLPLLPALSWLGTEPRSHAPTCSSLWPSEAPQPPPIWPPPAVQPRCVRRSKTWCPTAAASSTCAAVGGPAGLRISSTCAAAVLHDALLLSVQGLRPLSHPTSASLPSTHTAAAQRSPYPAAHPASPPCSCGQAGHHQGCGPACPLGARQQQGGTG